MQGSKRIEDLESKLDIVTEGTRQLEQAQVSAAKSADDTAKVHAEERTLHKLEIETLRREAQDSAEDLSKLRSELLQCEEGKIKAETELQLKIVSLANEKATVMSLHAEQIRLEKELEATQVHIAELRNAQVKESQKLTSQLAAAKNLAHKQQQEAAELHAQLQTSEANHAATKTEAAAAKANAEALSAEISLQKSKSTLASPPKLQSAAKVSLRSNPKPSAKAAEKALSPVKSSSLTAASPKATRSVSAKATTSASPKATRAAKQAEAATASQSAAQEATTAAPSHSVAQDKAAAIQPVSQSAQPSQNEQKPVKGKTRGGARTKRRSSFLEAPLVGFCFPIYIPPAYLACMSAWQC